MNTGGLILVIGSLLAATAAFIWMAFRVSLGGAGKSIQSIYEEEARKDVDHIFNNEFREELRNRGRLHFEKIIGESAMFLQQDLRTTTSQVNDYMRSEITKTLQEEFKKYEQSIVDAKQLALDSIEKTQQVIEQQREMLLQQLVTQAEAEKSRIIDHFEHQMSGIVNHYILQAVGNQIDLTDQLDYILAELEKNKAAIVEDVKRGT